MTQYFERVVGNTRYLKSSMSLITNQDNFILKIWSGLFSIFLLLFVSQVVISRDIFSRNKSISTDGVPNTSAKRNEFVIFGLSLENDSMVRKHNKQSRL